MHRTFPSSSGMAIHLTGPSTRFCPGDEFSGYITVDRVDIASVQLRLCGRSVVKLRDCDAVSGSHYISEVILFDQCFSPSQQDHALRYHFQIRVPECSARNDRRCSGLDASRSRSPQQNNHSESQRLPDSLYERGSFEGYDGVALVEYVLFANADTGHQACGRNLYGLLIPRLEAARPVTIENRSGDVSSSTRYTSTATIRTHRLLRALRNAKRLGLMRRLKEVLQCCDIPNFKFRVHFEYPNSMRLDSGCKIYFNVEPDWSGTHPGLKVTTLPAASVLSVEGAVIERIGVLVDGKTWIRAKGHQMTVRMHGAILKGSSGGCIEQQPAYAQNTTEAGALPSYLLSARPPENMELATIHLPQGMLRADLETYNIAVSHRLQLKIRVSCAGVDKTIKVCAPFQVTR